MIRFEALATWESHGGQEVGLIDSIGLIVILVGGVRILDFEDLGASSQNVGLRV